MENPTPIDSTENVSSNSEDFSPTPQRVTSARKIGVVGGFFAVVILLIAALIFRQFKPEEVVVMYDENSPMTVESTEKIDRLTFSPTFATYKEVAVNITPSVPSYTVSPGLTNVENADTFTFSNSAKSLLEKNAFVVMEGKVKEFYPLYESNRYSYIPSFVTTDSMLHNYHLMFNYLLEQTEKAELNEYLKQLSDLMLAESLRQHSELVGTPWENAAKRNVGFFAVPVKIFTPEKEIPSFVKNEVESELAFIEAHEGIKESPVMNLGLKGDTKLMSPQGTLGLEALKEDYSQYVPRGHYDKDENLQKYFKAMMWYGRLTFRFKSEDEIRSAILITRALKESPNEQVWNAIYEPVNFFVGKSDDVTYYQMKEIFEEVYVNGGVIQIKASDEKFPQFVEKVKELEPPQLNSIPIFNQEIQPDREKEIAGFRFMGQRFTLDAAIFQRLVDREVPNRMLPKGLDIPAAFGSREAFEILQEMGEDKYENYNTNMKKMQQYITDTPKENWTQNLYWSWLYALKPLSEVRGQGYPSFMTNEAWQRKELNTFLGSWTELKHDTLLYTKQVYSELGSGGPEMKDDRGYVEPNPYVYARLASLITMTKEGLAGRELLSDSMVSNLDKMSMLAMSLKTISEKELNGEPLTEEEFELIRSYGGQIEHFWLEVNKEEMEKSKMSQMNYLDENPAAIVADVATDPNGQALEEATGYISTIYVIFPIDGKLRIGKGGVYSYYEFTQPISDRLTDKAWREMLENDEAPELPTWTKAFMAE
jgi:hypothetical protein